jgi:hypothetical protein
MWDNLTAYKLTLLTPEEGTVLKNQSVVFSGEPPYIITWKKRSYKKVTVSDASSESAYQYLLYAEVSTCELTDIAVFLDRSIDL